MKVRKIPVILTVLLVALLVTTTVLADLLTDPPYEGEPTTAFQIELATAMSQRQAAGLPIPEVTFIAEPTQVEGLLTTQVKALAEDTLTTTTTATTVIYFEGPQQAGYDQWPAVEIAGSLAGDDAYSFNTGDLTDTYYKGIVAQMPDFWEKVVFGQEARKYSITETDVVSYPADSSLLKTNLLNSAQMITSGDILMGFTFTGPNIDKTVTSSAETCLPWWLGGECVQWYYLKTGFKLDWAFGLRLPASATLTGPDRIQQGNPANFETSLSPMDWDADSYLSYEVETENGNEFVFRYDIWAGIQIIVLNEEVCPLPYDLPCYIDFSDNKSTSFPTPFGTDSSFPIESLEIELYTVDVVNILSFTAYLTMTPLVTSEKITANWQAGGACLGNGTVTYTQPGTPVSFGPLSCNFDNIPSMNETQVSVKDFRYYFTNFAIVFGGKVDVNLVGVFGKSFQEDFFTLDLSKIFGGLGLYVGDHMQCTLNDSFVFTCDRKGPLNQLVLNVKVGNLPPIVDAGESYNGDEGSAIALSGANASDPDGDPLTYKWSVNSTLCFFDNDTVLNPNLTCSDNGIFIVTLNVDDGQATDSDTASVTVANVAPEVTLFGPTTADEGDTESYSYTVSDPGDEIFSRIESCGTGGTLSNSSFNSATGAGSFDCTFPDGPTSTDVSVMVFDGDDGSGSQNMSVSVNNVAPTLGAITPTPLDPVVVVGTSVGFGAPFTDPAGAVDEVYDCAFDWDGDNIVDEHKSVTYGACSASHTYPGTGVYTVNLIVTDKDGGVSNKSTYQYVVVYDPSAGFVTGGGWFNSPAGAYKPNADLSGKANFAFVSKYQKNATVPIGNTEFQFHAADLNFHSTSYDWLVVTGSNYAKFKGVGTINGMGEYKFQLWAGDDDPDTFRIKIWTEDEFGVETVVYDNGFDQAIEGGSIVIHTK